MKLQHFIYFLAALVFAACSSAENTASNPLDRAEQDFENGRYAAAQRLADSIMLDAQLDSMPVDHLCRLSLLLMRLGENANEEQANTAFAAKAINAAIARDSDSTATIMNAVDVDDRARAVIVVALSNASRHEADSIIVFNDSIDY